MIPISLYGKNFLSFEEVYYNFESKAFLVSGANKTNPGQKSNGSGKTALQNIIEYCLYGSVSRKVLDKKLVRRGQKALDAGLDIFCPVRKETLSIKRQIFLRGSSKLNILINDKEASFSTVKDGNDFILRWFGISKDDLQNYFIVNKDKYKSFFSASEREKIELISRFSNADIISGVETYVDSDIENKENEISKLKSEKNKIDGKIEALNSELEKENGRDLEVEKRRSVELIEDEIELSAEGIDEDKKDITKLNFSLSEINKKLLKTQTNLSELLSLQDEFNKSSFDSEKLELNTKIKNITLNKRSTDKNISSLNSEKREMNEILSDIEKNLKGSVLCPKCSHEFSISDTTIDINQEKEDQLETESIINQIGKDLIKFEKLIKDKDFEITSIEKEIDVIQNKESDELKKEREIAKNIREIRDTISDIEDDVRSNKSDISSLNDSIKMRLKNIESSNIRIVNLKKEELVNVRIKELKKSISDVKDSLSLKNESISVAENELFEIKQWFFNMKKFHQHLALKSLKVIEGHVNSNLKDINSEIQIKLEGFKLKSNGDVSEKITPYVLADGEKEEFGSFSGGERARMEFAMILAVQNMVNTSHPYGGFKFLSIDEVMERVDDEGLGSIMKSLSVFEMPIWVTTHVSDDKVFSDILKIEKINNISRIIK